jgi:hypothetical protein
MAAQLRHNSIIDRNPHVVNPGAAGLRNFPCGCDQAVAEPGRANESDVALCRHRTLIAGVAGEGECGIRKEENEPAMSNAVSVDHLRLDGHAQRGFPGFHLENFHAEALARIIFFPHCVCASARKIVG